MPGTLRIMWWGITVALMAIAWGCGGGGATTGDPDLPVAPSSSPPIAGGTLIVTGGIAIASVPEHDLVVRVDLAEGVVLSTTRLQPGDEPGRIATDAAGLIHVVLRGTGEVATIAPSDPERPMVRRWVCAEPRGLAFDPEIDALHVACVSGLLVTLPTGGGEAVRSVQLAPDLRDVVVEGDHLWVSRFRSGTLRKVDRSGRILERLADTAAASTAVVWRMLKSPMGGVAMVSEGRTTDVVGTGRESYGETTGECRSIVRSVLTTFADEDMLESEQIVLGTMSEEAAVVVDLALSPDGTEAAVAAAGNRMVLRISLDGPQMPGFGCAAAAQGVHRVLPIPVAVAYDPAGRLVVQTRSPASVGLIDAPVPLDVPREPDHGFQLFHQRGSMAIACASCHPEGREDGRTWRFSDVGPRRTQTLLGGVMTTTPFHWSGDVASFEDLVQEVLVERMGAERPTVEQVDALARWIDELPFLEPEPPADPEGVERGRAHFFDPQVGCADCHGGERLTDNLTYDVGTGGTFQVPSLIGLAARAPYLHNGCAATIEDRFLCGGTEHGDVTSLSPAQLGDLVTFLESL
jgi:mono/diheme cytochrome c family protein